MTALFVLVLARGALAWLDAYLPESMVVPVWAYLPVIDTMIVCASKGNAFP
jgi:hypothetical protein